MSKECLFCKIVGGLVPSQKVYENDQVLAFKDISPQAPFHILIIPKEHIPSAAEVMPQNSGVLAVIYEAIAEIAKNEKLDKGFRIVCNCGEHGQQTVGHLHFHMLAGRLLGWPPG